MRDARDVYVWVISLIETIYLVEKQRLPRAALQRLRDALSDPNAGLTIASVDAPVASALENISRNVAPEMPDRIIAATALRFGLPLVTRDRRLQAAGVQTIW